MEAWVKGFAIGQKIWAWGFEVQSQTAYFCELPPVLGG
jgi:hypothetical protein